MTTSASSLQKRVQDCMLVDRFRLSRKIQQLKKITDEERKAAELTRLGQRLEQSILLAETREKLLPTPDFPESLPVNTKLDEICKAIENNQVIILCGETGSGKTTQLPKICLKLRRGIHGMIGHTQPRRIAARSVANRIAEELKTETGQQVGFKVRFADKLNKNTHVKVMTDGILLAEIQNDPFLNQYDTLIIDEAHERSLNIDFILGYLKQLLPKRPDLKLIITSATIDPERFARHFEDAPVIEVSGRTYPVEVRYRPVESDEETQSGKEMSQAILNAADELSHEGTGDILVFLSGERQIRETAEFLRKHHPHSHLTEIIPLYSRLSYAEQQKVFASHSQRRIVLATNVAETSLTIPGIQYVIDTGYARISRYSYRSKVQRLPIEKISQASANQRKGRCGRTSDGICIRLYSEEDFINRSEFTDAEILRTNLASVILQMHSIGLGKIEKFPFIDRPDSRLIKDGYQLLEELQAIDNQKITSSGRLLARFPIEPRYARMIIAASQLGCLNEVLIIVSALSIAEPRERPLEKQQQADQAHARFKDEKSDFVAYLKLWEYFLEQKKHLSHNKLRQLCKKEFLSFTRMYEWRDIHSQLLEQCNELKYRVNKNAADYDSIHQALLCGLLSHIGNKSDEGEYQGARNTRFMIFPGSYLKKKKPDWIMAAEMLETQRHYAVNVAQIEPGWIEKYATHLLKKSWYEAHWEKKPAQVAAYEKSTLYGLVINPRKRVNYGPIDPVHARELFIRGALVDREYNGHAKFFQHNEKLFREIESLEHQSRRQDVLVDNEIIYSFYDERIPQGIYNSKSFDTWRKQAELENTGLLFLTKDYLMQHSAGHITEEQYPKQIIVNNTPLQLSYHFEPGSDNDGVTVNVPLALLNSLGPLQFEWLIPALLKEKVVQLIKTLPKQLRKNFVPAPHFAEACMDAIQDHSEPLLESLSRQLFKITGIKVDADAWQPEQLDKHYFMNFSVYEEKNNKQKVLASGRNLEALQQQLASRASSQFSRSIDWEIEQKGFSNWDFNELPFSITSNINGLDVDGYPAIQDDDDSVSVVVIDNQEHAEKIHHAGLKRLYLLQLRQQVKYLYKNLPGIDRLCLLYTRYGSCQELKDAIINLAVETSFDCRYRVRSHNDFETALTQGKQTFISNANTLSEVLTEILQAAKEIQKSLKQNNKPNWITSISDIQSDLDNLVYEDFLYYTSKDQLLEFPRYLEAIRQRLEKLATNADRDRNQVRQLANYWDQFIDLNDEHYDNPVFNTWRWMLEEYRVSLFAQGLKTRFPVSEKRIEKQWQEVKRAIR